MIARILICGAFACALGGVATAAPIQVSGAAVTPYSGAKVVSQPDSGNPLAGMQLFVRAGLDRQTSAQSGLAALVAECILRTPVRSGAALRDTIVAQGGSISYSIDGHWIRYYIEGLQSNFAGGMLAPLEQALAKPDFSPAALTAARAELNRKIAENQRIGLNVGLDMLNAAFFTDSDAGLPEYGIPATLAGLTGADAARFFETYYHRDGALVSAVGGVDASSQADFQRLLDLLPPGATRPAVVKIARLSGTQRRLVTHRDIHIPWVIAQFRAPSIDSPDFGAMLVLTSFLERTTAEAAENPSITTRPFNDRSVGTLYNFDERPANVVLYINGGNGDPSRAFNTALSVVQIFAHSKLSGDIGSMKKIAAGSYVDGITSLEDRAWLAGVFAMQDGSPNYIERGLDAIAKVKPEDLQRVARTYLDNPNVAIVLPRDTDAPN